MTLQRETSWATCKAGKLPFCFFAAVLDSPLTTNVLLALHFSDERCIFSEMYAYGCAVVDPVTRRAWVFGSPRDLCHHGNAPKQPNFVQAWWSDDLVEWHTSSEPALRLSSYPFNTDVTPVVDLTINGTKVNFCHGA